ncbi:helix-turn-helix domain-containing protein [Elioraea tepida]|jgi:predicted DNA-binding transcriptional regulator AlpA|uniref:Helix-turn-helix domain-containing protein n=1 Tax=Elioraea tepida TaxID=2843330 RepID=A0A975YKH4_9PROT|nr:helix-turn-helix domain-containing protein [Elioraea tepida]QXM25477.1 helix-turn-helix domain-containing protein [Elioraea tepida]
MMKLLSSDEVAEILGVSLRTLERMRIDGQGPAYVRLSPRRIAYAERDVIEWIERRRHRSRAAEARSAA